MNTTRRARHLVALGFAVAIAAPQLLSAQQRHGDVNGDGVVSALDAQAILSAVVGLPLPPSFVISNGVSRCDGRTAPGALDAQIVLSFVIGLNVSGECVGQTFGPGASLITMTPGDTSVLVNRRLQLRAVLRDPDGFLIQRPVVWQTSNADLVTIDSARGDTAWVSNHYATTGAADASATLTAHADGSIGTIQVRVHRSYAGIVIVPQRPDTLRQLNGITSYNVRLRDSVGTLGAFTNAFWTSANTDIATVSPGTATTTGSVTALTMGSTFLHVVSQSNPLVRDSARLTVALTPFNNCTGTGGTLHSTQTYSTPQTWTPAGNPHYVSGTQSFAAGSRLTIDAGTLVCTQGGAFLVFHAGSRLQAIGTFAQPIVFRPTTPTDFWSGIQLGDFTSVAEPTDTSELRNVRLERISNGSGGIQARERHLATLDSVHIRQSNVDAVALASTGSRMIRSRIDTILTTGAFNYGAILGRASLEETTIRVGGSASGIQVSEAATIRQVSIVGGTTAITQSGSQDSVRMNDVTISGTVGVALDLPNGLLHPVSGNVQISGGSGGGFRGSIGNLGLLFPDSVSQETLKNNGRDTIAITSGALVGRTLVVRPDLPWRVSAQVTIDTLAVLAPRPGATLLFESGGLIFQRGGTLVAQGEAAKVIRFMPTPGIGQNFFGLSFQNPGAAADPQNNQTAVSTLAFVQVDSASGATFPAGGICHNSCSAALNAGDRHRLLIDNAVIHKAFSGAVYMNTPGSQISNSVIDTTGTVGTSYTSNSAALALGERTVLQNVLVRRSGEIGIYALASPAADTSARLQNVRVVASRGAGLYAQTGVIAGDFGSVRIDSANAYPFEGSIQNFATLVRDSVSQLLFTGNVDDVAVMTASSVRGTVGTHTTASPLVVEAIPGLRWRVQGVIVIDTLARLVARPASDFGFINTASLSFQSGGTLHAVGEAAKVIRFRPVLGSTFAGLQFQNVGTTPNPADNLTAISTLTWVQLDSATGAGFPTGGLCPASCSAAINAGDRHRLMIDNARIHKAWSGAIYINTPLSQVSNTVVDTTGNVASGYITNTPAIALGERTVLLNSTVHRSGSVGVFTFASPATDTSARLQNVRIVASQSVGLQAEQGILAGDFGSVRIDSANAYPFQGSIQNFAAIARDSVTQLLLLNNVDNAAVFTAGTLRGTVGTHTTAAPLVVEAIPGLRWQVHGATVIDSLARLVARPASDFTFVNANFSFQSGGTLSAIGEAAKIIRFRPVGGGNFHGLQFQNVGTTPNPADNLTAVSTLTWVRLDSATGVGFPTGGLCPVSCSAAINAGDRHRLLIDNARIHKAWSGAIYVNTPLTQISNTVVDTTGNVASGYTTNTPAMALGERTLMQNSTVHRSGNVGVFTFASPATDTSARLQNVRIVASQSVGLQAEQGILAGDLGTVRIDSANAYPFQGSIQNLAAIARDSVNQLLLLNNIDNAVVITTGTLRGTPIVHSVSPLTVEAIPGLRWQVHGAVNVDSLARLSARPGTDFTFVNGHFIFQNGGTLSAIGEAAKIIRFRPVGGGNFHGLQFANVGDTPNPVDNLTAVSSLAFVRLDSASGLSIPAGGICPASCSAAINAGNRHRLLIDNARIHRAWSGAIYATTPLTAITNSLIDTTGNVSTNYTTNTAAIALNDSVSMTNVVVHRSGQNGIYIDGDNISITGVRVSRPLGIGIEIANNSAATGSNGLQLSGFTVDSAGGVGVSIQVSNLTLTTCDVLRGATHGFATTSTGLLNISIHDCNVGGRFDLGEQNLGQGVLNFAGNLNPIDAVDNWWGALDGQLIALTPILGGVNGILGTVNAIPIRPTRRP